MGPDGDMSVRVGGGEAPAVWCLGLALTARAVRWYGSQREIW
ncbi:MAG: hypothetical protein OJF49_002011 [Ktedonobacterales bacterium]|nr:MAG: hypothetical protein OJF49_002011 [Ktedonobacterales bacterium]